MTEQELIEGCRLQDERYQEKLYDLFYADMLRVCLRYSKTKEDAGDILNRGFLKVFTHISTYRFDGAPGAWIRKIMVNTAIDFYRRQPRTTNVCLEEKDIAATDIEIEPEIYRKTNAEEILILLKSIPDIQQMVFNLYAIEGYTYSEIAQLLNIKESTCRWHLMEARKSLKQKLEQLLQTKNTRHEDMVT